MSFEAARKLIAEVADALDVGIPVEWENATPQKAAVWGRWVIQHGAREPAIIGEGHVRGTGILYLQVFIAEGLGTKPATVAADLVATLDRQQLRRAGEPQVVVTMETSGMLDVGNRSGYVQKNIMLPFTVDVYSEPFGTRGPAPFRYFVIEDTNEILGPP